MTEEIFKDIEGYEGVYAITNHGRVWSSLTNKFLSSKGNGSSSHQSVYLRGKKFYVHRLVASAFIGIPEGKVVNHLDGDPKNNILENLEVVTQSENCAHGYRIGLREAKATTWGESHHKARLSEKDVRDIRAMRKSGMTYKNIASLYGVHLSTIAYVVSSKNWSHVK